MRKIIWANLRTQDGIVGKIPEDAISAELRVDIDEEGVSRIVSSFLVFDDHRLHKRLTKKPRRRTSKSTHRKKSGEPSSRKTKR